jgi:hypothetical protein
MNELPEDTGRKEDGTFKRGISGNPSGRPKGSRNRTTVAIQEILDGEAETITRKVIELAKQGDITAIRLVMERLLPARKDSPITIELPESSEDNDLGEMMSAIINAVCDGKITLNEGQALSALLENCRKAKETCELERKLDELHTIINPNI